MKGLYLDFNDVDKRISLMIDPAECDPKTFELKAVKQFFLRSDYGRCFLDEEALISAVDVATMRIHESSFDEVSASIAQQIDAKLVIDIEKDSMSVTATIVGAFGGEDVKTEQVLDRLNLLGIRRGIGKRHINILTERAKSLAPGAMIEAVIAKGLPARRGKNSRVIPLVENALERILKPQKSGHDKVDMRDLGQIICVKQDQAVAKILPPQPGRDGYDIYNRRIGALYGEQIEVELGSNTEISAESSDLIIASVAGQPKFTRGVMHIDDVYSVDGVTVRTGNVEYDGAVIVNGDVTESMKIVASGDVTINGFVESAIIRTDGDIIITQGIAGKPDNDDCVLEAGGSVSVFHAQHTKIIAKNNVHVSKQISHSHISCAGALTVGKSEEHIDGNIFACFINAGGRVEAGKIGAVSGSKLEIDYTQAFMHQSSKLDALEDLRGKLESSNADHEIKLVKIKQKRHRPSIVNKLDELSFLIKEERILLAWLRQMELEYQEKLDAFKNTIKIIAHQSLYANVVITINKEMLKTNQEKGPSAICFEQGSWKQQELS